MNSGMKHVGNNRLRFPALVWACICLLWLTDAHAQNPVYTCPMHPEVRSGKPGHCPKCGMNLVAAKVKQKPVKAKPKPTAPPQKQSEVGTKYTCPMHPEVVATQPGNCPKCGMRLVRQAQKTTPTPATKTEQPQAESPTPPAPAIGQSEDADVGFRLAKANLGKIRTTKQTRPPRTVRYDLHVRDTIVAYGGKKRKAIAVNGQIPMPTLTFTEGDTAEIHVYNHLGKETALHWHGLFLPNRMDGVPFLTQMPIRPGAQYLYKFPLVQHGTHWYHSHSGLQEQVGMYGMFIINKRDEWDIPTIPLLISEWTNMKPEEVHRRLKTANDWFAIRKGTTQSYAEAIANGHFNTKITNEWKRMTAMDVSDVYYDQFLINGKNQDEHPQFRAGNKVRLRIANGGASDNFWVSFAGGKLTVVASDGNEVEPVEVDRLLIAVSETYDVVVTIPESKSYELLVTPEDRTKFASLWLGSGEKIHAPKLPRLKYFEGMKMMNEMMDGKGNLIETTGMKMQNQIMDMNSVMYPETTGDAPPPMTLENSQAQHPQHAQQLTDTIAQNTVTLNYDMLRAPEKTVLPGGPVRELHFELTGNMNRYVWSLDNKVVSETDDILIKKGENLRLVLFNNSMMRHPMHLHGHDFRVLNAQKEYAPMKNVIDIMPMERDTIEFAANESDGNWFFHCHILYHMMSGMGRVFRYDNSPPNPELPNEKWARRKLNADDRAFHLMAENDFAINGNDGMVMVANTRWSMTSEWRLGYNNRHGYESETHLGRYVGRMQWFMPFIGFDYRYRKQGHGESERNLFSQFNTKDRRVQFSLGTAYTLPMLVVLQGEVYHDGNVRLQLMREDIPIAARIRAGFMVNTDKEYMADLRYVLGKNTCIRLHYDSDMHFGAGLMLNY